MSAPPIGPATSPAVTHETWLQRCRDAVSAGTGCARLQAELDDEDSPIHQLLQYESVSQWISEPQPDPGGDIPTPELAAARVIVLLAQALVGEQDPKAAVTAALAHFDATMVRSVGTQLVGGDAAATVGDGPLPTMVREAMTTGSRASRGVVILLLLELSGRRPVTARHTRMPVLFASSDHRGQFGEHGRLSVEVLAGGPSGIHPDPATMAFSQLTESTWRGIESAWATSSLRETGACVVWTVADGDGAPCPRIEGDSMSAAFAVCLDDIAPASRLRRRLRWHRLDHDCAVTAGLDGDRLLEVDGYPDKFDVAREEALRVVIAESALSDAVKVAAADFVDSIVGAETVDDAIAATRSMRNRALVTTVAALLLVIALAVAGGIVAYQRIESANRERLATELAVRSAGFANSDSRLAALLALTADRVHSSPTTLAAMRTVADNNESVVSSARAAGSAVDYVAAYGRLTLTAGSSALERKTLRAWMLPDLQPLGDIALDGTVRGLGGAGYSGTGLAAAIVGSKLELFQGLDGMPPTRVASFESGLDDGEVFGPFVDADTNAVVAFDGSGHGVFWAPGMTGADTFDLGRDLGAGRNIVAVSGFGSASGSAVPADTEQQRADTSGHTVLIGTSDRKVYGLVIDRPAKSTGTTRVYAAKPVFATSMDSQIYSLAITNSGAVLVGTNDGLEQYYRGSDEADIDKTVKERVTDIVIPEMFADSVMFVSAKGLGMADSGSVFQLMNTDSTVAVTRTVRSIAVGGDGTVVTGRSDGSVVLQDPASSLTRLPELFGATDVEFSADGELVRAAVTGKDSNTFSSVQVSRPSTRTDADLARAGSSGTDSTQSYQINGQSSRSQVFSADATKDHVVAAGVDHSTGNALLLVWDRQAPDQGDRVTRTFSFQGSRLSSSAPDVGREVALSPDGVSVYGFNPGRGEFTSWRVRDGSVNWSTAISMTGESAGVLRTKATFDRARNHALIDYFAPDRSRRHALVDLSDGKVRTLGFLTGVEDTVLSPNGDMIAASTDNSVTTFTIDGQVVGPSTNLGGIIGHIAWSPDQRRLVTDLFGSGLLLFLSPETIVEVAPRWRMPGFGPSDYVTGLSWSPDGRFLGVNVGVNQRDEYYRTKAVRVLRTDRIDMTPTLCAIAGSELTPDEWRKYVGDTDQFAVCSGES